MTLPLETQVARLRNQNEMLEEKSKQQALYITQLEDKLEHRAASNFVAKLQQQERPVTDYAEYIEIRHENEELADQIDGLNRELQQLNAEFGGKEVVIEGLQKELAEFEENMKRLIASSKQLNAYNERLKEENASLQTRVTEMAEGQQSVDDLELAFELVEEQQTEENNDLKEEIIELKDELFKAQQSAEFSLDQQKAASEQAMLWQENYETLLSEFKSQKQLEKSVKFEDITQVIEKTVSSDSGTHSNLTDSLRPEVSLAKDPILDKAPTVRAIKENVLTEARQKALEIVRKGQDVEDIEIDVRENAEKTDNLTFKDLDGKLITMLGQSREPGEEVSVTRICRDLCGTNAVENEIGLLEQSIGEMLRIKEQMCE